MTLLAYSLLLVLCGWHLRGAIGGMWRRVYRPHRFGDGQHLWLEVNGEAAAFTDDQVEVAQVRAQRLTDPRKTWWKRLAWVLTLAVLILVCMTGCVGDRTGGAIWWNPTTWAARAAPAAADRAAAKVDTARTAEDQAAAQAVTAAHKEVAKSDLALAAAADSRPVALARRTTANALGLLDQVKPLTAEESAEIRQLVADLLSDNAQTVAAAESKQRTAEEKLAEAGRELTAARAKLEQREAELTKANGNLREAYDRENALANKVRNFWFILGGLALFWVLGNVLSVAARFNPGLAGVSRLVNGVTAPAFAFAEARAADGLQKVGHALARAKQAMPEVADKLVTIFDTETDRDHQRAIGAAANTAPRT
jgi:hypothetical protein